ncbi:methionyl-tRNA formyltransferase [Granulibacter bethesdensis]|uniref:methionyl-tRNA formyltransferase n=1 Tax=Granulibacter bethesdensis TaxID=364410 RepID=UPI00090B4FAE|nr:methionyl-tRNA formyltransferase [Granulibacter bethesdensis]APH59012.1 Methionyl-tRNA formyltransferase [Granulibacter bethesdensis]
MAERLTLAFMGSPDFSVPALHALHQAGHHIAAVYTQPPRPAGRGHRLTPCPVHRAAEALGLEVRHPARLKNAADEHEAFRALNLDAAVVAAYGLILPRVMLDTPQRGCLNIHASLLPRWRGASPIQSAILAGDTESGVTIMRMEEGLDTGPMLLKRAVPITETTTTPELHDALATAGAEAILHVLETQPDGESQDDALACYAPKLSRADGLLDWSQPAALLARRVRALNPWPGTFSGGLKILAAHAVTEASGIPGTVIGIGDDTLLIACGDGALCLDKVQKPGRPALDAAAFLRGHKLPAGTRLDEHEFS